MAEKITIFKVKNGICKVCQKFLPYPFELSLIAFPNDLTIQVGDRNNGYNDFLNDLHQMDGDADDCRYGLYDYEYKYNPDGAESTFKSKMFLMSWCPDSSRIKKKMLYSSR